MAGVLDERFILNISHKQNGKARHNHFTQVRNAAIVFTTEDSHGLIEFKANSYNKLISKCCSIVCHDGSSLYKNTHRAVERISDD